MSPSITDLPQELLDKITAQLTSQDINRLSRSCTHLRAATLTALYKEISMRWEGPEMKDAIDPPRLDLLLRSILEDPELAKSIKAVRLHAVGFRTPGYKKAWTKPLPLPVAGLSQLFKDALAEVQRKISLSSELHEKWRAGIEQGDTDALICLLLAVCTNITSLTLGLDFIRDNKYLPDFLAELAKTPTSTEWFCFQHLREVQLGARILPIVNREDPEGINSEEDHWDKIMGTVSTRAYLTLLRAPVLETAEMALGKLRTYPWRDDKGVEPLEMPPMPNLTRLRFFESRLHPQSLPGILRSAPALVELVYEHYTRCPQTRDMMDCGELRKGLEPVREQLVRFELRCDSYWGIIVAPWDCNDPMIMGHCSFRDFTALESLRVPVCVLLGWEPNSALDLLSTLPPNLVTLCLRLDYGAFIDFEWKGRVFIELVTRFLQNERWRERCPRLKQFDVVDEDECLSSEEREEIRDLCKANGLACSVEPSEGGTVLSPF